MAPLVATKRKTFASFRDFYPFYLNEHSRRWTRWLHVAGCACAIGLLVAAPVTRVWWLLALTPVAGYGFAWVGHVFVEKNRPATFTHPFYSFAGDWIMFVQTLSGRLRQ